MTQESMRELMQKPEIKEAMNAMIFNFYQQQKVGSLKRYKMLNPHVKKGQIVFVGSSSTEFFPINEMQLTLNLSRVIYNRGIGSTVTDDLLATMNDCIFDLEPSKIFINIGSNDIAGPGPEGYNKEKFLAKYDKIMDQIKERLPGCEVYVMAFYPVNVKADFGLDKTIKARMFATRTNANLMEANEAVERLAKNHGFNFINVNEGLSDEEGNLKAEYSVEGLHMWPNAYAVVLENMKKYL